MKLKRNIQALLTGTVMAVSMLFLPVTSMQVLASNSSVQVKTTVKNVKGGVGDEVEIPLTISSSQELRGFSGKLSGNYDESVLEFEGMDTSGFPADGMKSVAGGNFSYLTGSGDSTFSEGTYTLIFKILKESTDPVTVTIQDLYYTDGTSSSDKTTLEAKVTVEKGGKNSETSKAEQGTNAGSGTDTAQSGSTGENKTGTSQVTEGNTSDQSSAAGGTAAAADASTGNVQTENGSTQNETGTVLPEQNGDSATADAIEKLTDTTSGTKEVSDQVSSKETSAGKSKAAVVIPVIVVLAVIAILVGVKKVKSREKE